MQLLPMARLLRLPNVFTALADIALGVSAALGIGGRSLDGTTVLQALLLFVASGCLYCSGMVWNDLFDLEEDRRDRPFRPLARGQFTVRFAVMLAGGLMLAGVLTALASGMLQAPGSGTPAILAVLLAGAILLYDGVLKSSALAPVAMGLCRLLNVLLGLTLSGEALSPFGQAHLAGVVGLYIVGVTTFARTEERRSDPRQLQFAAAVMLAAVLLALGMPARLPQGHEPAVGFPYLLVLLVFVVGVKLTAAIQQPTPQRVQAGVKRSILALILLDATLATLFVGHAGLLILLLLPPGLILGRRVYST